MLTLVGRPLASAERPRGFISCRLPIVIGGTLLAVIALAAILAPFLGTVDPEHLAPAWRLRPPSEAWWFGTDHLGRDLYSRVLYGARASLVVGLTLDPGNLAAIEPRTHRSYFVRSWLMASCLDIS